MCKCNYCGNAINEQDFSGRDLEWRFGYGSAHDEDILKFNLCGDCTDKLASEFIKICKIKPIMK